MISRRLRDSFIDISNPCSDKARQHYNIKENALIASAEKAVYIGVCFDDGYTDPLIKEYFYKLKDAFDDSFRVTFYLNSDYIFFFEEGLLINIHRVHEYIRGHIQKIWINNKEEFSKLSKEDRLKVTKERVNNFKIDNGIEDEEPPEKVVIVEHDEDDFYGQEGWWGKYV